MALRRNQVFALVCSLYLVGTLAPVNALVELSSYMDCVEVVAKGVAAGALIGVPTLRTAVRCSGFQPAKSSGLDANALLLTAYAALGKLAGSPKCVVEAANAFNKELTPHVNKFTELKCI